MRSYSLVVRGLSCAAIASVAVPPDICDWVISELQANKASSDALASETLARLIHALQDIDTRVRRLTDAYPEGVMSIEEYRESKERLISDKLSLKEKLTAEERQRRNRFEPLSRGSKR